MLVDSATMWSGNSLARNGDALACQREVAIRRGAKRSVDAIGVALCQLAWVKVLLPPVITH